MVSSSLPQVFHFLKRLLMTRHLSEIEHLLMAVLVFLVLSVIFMLAVQMSAFSPYNERT